MAAGCHINLREIKIIKDHDNLHRHRCFIGQSPAVQIGASPFILMGRQLKQSQIAKFVPFLWLGGEGGAKGNCL